MALYVKMQYLNLWPSLAGPQPGVFVYHLPISLLPSELLLLTRT